MLAIKVLRVDHSLLATNEAVVFLFYTIHGIYVSAQKGVFFNRSRILHAMSHGVFSI